MSRILPTVSMVAALIVAVLAPVSTSTAEAAAASPGCVTYAAGDTCSLSRSGSTYTLAFTFSYLGTQCADASSVNCLYDWELLVVGTATSSPLQGCTPTWQSTTDESGGNNGIDWSALAPAPTWMSPNIPASISCTMTWQSGHEPDLPAALVQGLNHAVVATAEVCDGGCAEETGHGVAISSGQTISGTVLQGARPGSPFSPTKAESGAKVTVKGTTSKGAAYSDSATTGASGGYGFDAPAGVYTVSFPDDVCVTTRTTSCVESAKVTVNAALDPVAVDATALRGSMTVTVTPNPKRLTLAVDKKSGAVTPKPVKVTVKVTNTGLLALTRVTPAEKLVVGYHDPADVSVGSVPLRPDKGPSPKTIASLKPGKSAEATYTLKAQGDGKFDAAAIVTAADPKDRTVRAAGTGQVLIGSPVLIMRTSLGRVVRSASHRSMVAGGTNFSIRLQLQNVSYTKKIAIDPMYCASTGNATDGHVQNYSAPIQSVSLQADTLSDAIVLNPRQKADLACVERTASLPADVVAPSGKSVGGTRAVVDVPDIKAWVIKSDQVGARLKGADVFVDGDSRFTESIDDSDLRPEPEEATIAGTAFYFTQGLLQGAWNLTGGAVCGLFTMLPQLAAAGIQAIPSAIVAYVQLQVELFDAIKDDPVLLSQFINPLTNTTLLAYKNAPQLIGNAADFKARIEQEVLAGYTKMWNDWHGGNRQAALAAFGQEFAERGGDLAMAIAPGLLARNPQVLAAFVSNKSRLYAQVTEELGQYSTRLVNAVDAVSAMAKTLKPGYEMSNAVLRKFFGLTDAQSQFLRGFAEEHKLLIVARSRATESITWIERYGAVLKPEMIKIKNVKELDLWLGYGKSDLGRVVIKTKLPGKAAVEARLARAGFKPGDAQWTEVLKQLADRQAELSSAKPGYVKDLERIAKDKEVTLKFNLAGNAVDPTAAVAEPTTYGFRLARSSTGDLVPQFQVSGSWRSVTGDVDFLQITHANGTPLSDAERVRVYSLLSKSPVGLMHGESATWTMLDGAFAFDQKTNEFERAGFVAQFGADGQSRAVTFNKSGSKFTSKSNYTVSWNGGYTLPQGPAVP